MKPTQLAACAIAIAFGSSRSPVQASAWAGAPARQDRLESLAKKLQEADEEARRDAVEDLARLKTPEAWALVVDSLADPSPLVADEAQLRLGEVADALSSKSIFGKAGLGSKDAIVQQRAAESLGRSSIEVDGVALAKGLSARDPDTRRTAARALERLADAERLEKKSKLFVRQQLDQVLKNDKDPLVRAAAIPARHAVEGFTVSDLFEMLSKKDAGVVRASATHTLATVAFGQIPGLYNTTLESEEPCAVRALVTELYRNPSATSAGSLTAVLERYPDLRLGWMIIDCLRDLSGQYEQVDKASWRGWGRTLPHDWVPQMPPARPVQKRYVTKAELLGQPVISDRVAILVDVTGWPEEKRADGSLQKARVRSGISRMLADLPEGAQFNLVPYAGAPAAFEKKLVDATPANVKRALKSFDECASTGKDHFLEAACLALSDKSVDTILVVTDGAPAGARHVNPDLVREELTQRNRFQTVVLDAVLIHPDAAIEEEWRKLCSPSGGRVTTASP